MSRRTGLVSVCCLAVLLSVTPLLAQKSSSKSSSSSKVARGKYLVTISGCHDCHTPKLDAQGTPDMARALSGRPSTTMPPQQREGEITASMDLTAWAGPWGISYTANLTPDPETGLGRRYDEAKFIQSLRTGRKPEGEPLLPPMPWPMIAQMTDDDLKAVWAYMKTLKPIRNNVKASPAPAAAR